MSSQNFSAKTQRTIPPEYIPPMSLHRFCEISGLSKVSAWRYEKHGWLRTHLIANRRYILAADVAEFNRRLASDEFAGSVPNPSVARSIKPKKENVTNTAGTQSAYWCPLVTALYFSALGAGSFFPLVPRIGFADS
jgi:hypothetical protein